MFNGGLFNSVVLNFVVYFVVFGFELIIFGYVFIWCLIVCVGDDDVMLFLIGEIEVDCEEGVVGVVFFLIYFGDGFVVFMDWIG